MPVFTPGTPPANQVLATTQPLLQANLDYLTQTGNVDHNYANNTATANNGYHKVIHLIRQANPVAILNIGQLYVSNGTSAIQDSLNFKIVGGQNLQLTVPNFAPTQAIKGSTFLPGGFLMNWGFVPFAASGTETFNTAFTTCYNIQASLTTGAPTPNGTGTVAVSDSPGAASFSWKIITSSGSYTGFFYSAIGLA